MNEYRIECHACDDEMTVICGTDVPAFCPLCGEEDLVVTRMDEELDIEVEDE